MLYQHLYAIWVYIYIYIYHLLHSSKNLSIRDLWEVTGKSNVRVDSLLNNNDLRKASAILRDVQAKESIDHLLGLKSQGIMTKTVIESVLPKNIQLWKQVMDSLPQHVFNFSRKAMQSQLPT